MKPMGRVAVVGLGGRHQLFRDEAASRGLLCGVCDSNPGRVEASRRAVREKTGREIPGYAATDFDRMVAETRADTVVVTTLDREHDTYLCRAMDLGCDAVTEKPMTIDADRCRRILETQARTGRRLRVCFNYRYAPVRSRVKELLQAGVIGEVLSIDFHWLLDTRHGADYFRRWHRHKANSGGLLVHKATHHFDLVNWWLDTVPETVYAQGHRRFYVPGTAERLGLAGRGPRCRGCPVFADCPFALDLACYEELRTLYLDCEHHDGYFRDQCPFSEDIDIEDAMSVSAAYANGAKLSYSLTAFAAWEGYTIAFNGTAGRLEHKCEETAYINADGSVPGALKAEGTWIRVYPLRDPAYAIPLGEAEGGHGGADPLMLRDLFADVPAPDPLHRAADQRAGAWSILTGIAANQSIREGRPIRLRDFPPGTLPA
jgi:predicted dehydrogenase